jgi:hypothetical protein
VEVHVAGGDQWDGAEAAQFAKPVEPHLVVQEPQQVDAEPAAAQEVVEQPAGDRGELRGFGHALRRREHHAVGQLRATDVGNIELVGSLLGRTPQLGDELAQVAVAVQIAGEHGQHERRSGRSGQTPVDEKL